MVEKSFEKKLNYTLKDTKCIIEDTLIPDENSIFIQLQQEATEALEQSPIMRFFFERHILSRNNLVECLASRLASVLETREINEQYLYDEFYLILSQEHSIMKSVCYDFYAVMDRDPACHRYLDAFCYFKGFHALLTYRLGHYFWHCGNKDLSLFLQSLCSRRFAADIHPGARIGKGIMIDHCTGIVIGETCVLEDCVWLLHGVTLGGMGKVNCDRHPKIGVGVLIGAGATILGNIEIGACSKIAAGSVVLNHIPANRTAAGIPAKVIGYADCS